MADDHPLKTYREKQEPPLSQADLAKLLNVSFITVWRWEAHKRSIDERLLPSVSEKTGISRDKLRPDLAELLRQPEGVAGCP